MPSYSCSSIAYVYICIAHVYIYARNNKEEALPQLSHGKQVHRRKSVTLDGRNEARESEIAIATQVQVLFFFFFFYAALQYGF